MIYAGVDIAKTDHVIGCLLYTSPRSASVASLTSRSCLSRRPRFFSYGKKLAFHHVPAQLTEHARRVALFLDRAVALRCLLYTSRCV